MGILTRLLGLDGIKAAGSFPFDTYDPAQRVLPDPYEPFTGFYSGGIPIADPGVPLAELTRANVEALWRAQPNVRKVVDFIARNVASIPLHTFERVSDTDRRRVHDGPLATTISTPQARVSPYRFWHAVISDGLLYDRWAVLRQDTGTGVELVQIPSWRLRLETDALRRVRAAWYWVGGIEPEQAGDRDGWRPLNLDLLIFDHGYAPKTAGLSPMETLADVLAESAEAVRYRRQVWRNGARTPQFVQRPKDAPEWSPQARDRWAASFRDTYTGDGPNAGGVPLLEDGMAIVDLKGYAPQDTQDLEGRRLSAVEVAASFHIAPELVGAQPGNYSNIDAFRQMLYGPSLGPYIDAWQGALNAQLVPALADGRSLYVEAAVESKLRGSFVEQAQIMQSATGAPWLTRNEARAMQNRPPVDGGDELVVPLNVLVGGLASPRDTGSQNVGGGQLARRALAVKARPPETYTRKASRVLSAFFARQRRSVLSALGAKADDGWWDEERWDSELADDLFRLSQLVSTEVASRTLDSLGVSPDEYDADRTLAYLRAVSERVGKSLNTATRMAIEAALSSANADGDSSVSDAVGHVFDVAETSRANSSAMTVVTTFAGFATTEAAKQASGGKATKTWVVTSGNPRSSHAALNGETVGIDDPFSNGAQWPGDAMALDVDDIAGCQCDVTINLP